MVTLSKIYTRGGDKGQTSLSDGSRRAKTDPLIEAYGAVDETNAAIGVARLHTDGEADAMLARIQNDLFDLGADLATPHAESYKWEPLRIVQTQVDRLEAEIDAMNERLEPLKSFILPGGGAAAAQLHMARTICRRAERLMWRAAETAEISDAALKYVNRLSDHLFVLGRVLNDDGRADVLWTPGANR
ncbi:MAG: ATP:cob(I)alamin adenosyltransferase [Rhizobiales bacterium NRL2]|jgi:cob(I)alamin adenosyltransferase|nr:MAG: ATP:cob(I)alamin adenosyltransferase [Rhizobiales bacterium NRL2]